MGFSPRYVRDYFAQSKLKTVLIWIVEIALVILLAAGVSSFFCRSIVVQEGSMEPTLKAGDRALINSAAYKLSSPRRGDIVVFRAADDAKSSLHIKRVIGLPGETVQIKGSTIYIDGKPLKENYGKDPIDYAGIAEKPIKLGDDEYFVLGDNREISRDSRYEEVGKVKRKNIEGRAVLRIYPFNKFGTFR